MTPLIGFVERLLWAIRWRNRMAGGGRANRRGRKTGGRVPVAARGKGRGV